MDREKFIECLEGYGIDKNIVCFDDTLSDDVFCVVENYSDFEVFYRERGKEYDNKHFKTQDEALEYLLEYLRNIANYL